MKLLLGSNNKHKAKEIKNIFNSAGINNIQLLTLGEVFEKVFDVEEDRTTLKENAYKKAKEYYLKASIPCFADDTGLEIDALDGAPGVFSARYSGKHGNDQANRIKVLKELRNTPLERRKARFRTVICFYDGSNAEYIEGICEGNIGFEEKGSNGFGYDSIFVPKEYNKTFAEMTSDEKDEISHRGLAIRKFAEYLKSFID